MSNRAVRPAKTHRPVDVAAELRRRNGELTARNEALERLQVDQRELIAFIVHDLKTPLAVVWSNVDFAREQAKTEATSVREALDEAVRAARRLRAMIDDLLTMSRLEQSEFPVSIETIALAEVLSEVAREYLPLADEKHIAVTFPHDAEVYVRADRTLLQRVIENIVDNSLRHTPSCGRLEVTVAVEREVVIAVSNSGPPIPLEERGRVFEKFTRLDGRGALQGRAGLGLYFCKRALEAQMGTIEISQTPEWPTTFLVRLPRL